MDFLEALSGRNAEFAKSVFNPALKIIPTQKTMILACVDPRVDPVDVLQLQPGEAAIIRNVGGRVNPQLFETMDILRTVSKAGGQEMGTGWNLILLQHTQCGIIGCNRHAPGLLAKYMDVPEDGLGALEIEDPYKAVALDIDALRANPNMPGGFTVTGIVYDVTTGLTRTVVPPALLRAESA